MLCPFKADIVLFKIEGDKSLYWSMIVNMESIRRQVVLLYCCAMLERDVLLLHHRFYLCQGQEWWASISVNNSMYTVTQAINRVTLLLCNASANCCAPAAWISLHARLRAVSVYIDNSSAYVLDQKINCLTVLFCNARARCRAPSGSG